MRRRVCRAVSPPWEVLIKRSAGGERELRRGVRVAVDLRGLMWFVRFGFERGVSWWDCEMRWMWRFELSSAFVIAVDSELSCENELGVLQGEKLVLLTPIMHTVRIGLFAAVS